MHSPYTHSAHMQPATTQASEQHLQPRRKPQCLIRQPPATSREDVGSGQLQLSASRLLVPARHHLGRLSKNVCLDSEGSCPDLPILFQHSSELEASTWHCQDVRGSVPLEPS